MFDYLRGKLVELTPTKAVLDINGMGFELNISLYSQSAIEGKEEALLYVYENIREDAWTLFGFATQEERSLFLMLTSVSGIGGGTARTILSALSPAELQSAILSGNVKLLTGIKGIGKRGAERIIVELKDKIPASELLIAEPTSRNVSALTPEQKEKEREAIQALTMLGFSPAPTRKVVVSLIEQHPEYSTEEIIKQALKAI